MRTCRDRRFRPVTRKLGERSQCQIYSSKPHFSRCAVCTAPIKSRGRGPGIQSVSSGAVGHNYSRDHMAPRAESRQLHHDTLCFNIVESERRHRPDFEYVTSVLLGGSKTAIRHTRARGGSFDAVPPFHGVPGGQFTGPIRRIFLRHARMISSIARSCGGLEFSFHRRALTAMPRRRLRRRKGG